MIRGQTVLEIYDSLTMLRTTTTTTTTTTTPADGPYDKTPLGVLPKNGRKCRIRRHLVEFFENGFGKNHEIFQAYRGHSDPQICRNWRHYLLPVGCNIQLGPKYCTEVRKTGPLCQDYNKKSPKIVGLRSPADVLAN